MREHPANVASKLSQQFVFFGSQMDPLTTPPYLAQIDIDDDVTDSEPVFLSQHRLPVAKAGTNAGEEFIGVERLSHVVVRP